MNRDTTDISSASLKTGAPEAASLSGSMGTFRLFALVMAFVSPLVCVAGWIVILIAYGGPGAPGMMLVATILVALFSVGFVAMGHHMPNPGAFYSYVAASLGRVTGLGAGFVAVVTYVFLALSAFVFFGVAGSNFVVDQLHGPHITWYWFSLLLWVIISIFGYFNVEVSAKVLLVAMSLEIVVVLIFDVAIFGGRVSETGGVSLEPFSWHSLAAGGGWGLGLLFAILFFNGFEGTAAFREEVKDPARTIGRATFSVVAFVGIFYCLASWAIISYFGIDKAVELSASDPVSMFTTALEASVGRWMVDIANVLLLSSIFASTLSVYSILARYIYSLGVDRVLPRQLGTVHPKHNSPHIAAFAGSIVLLAVTLPFVSAGSDASLLYGQLGGVGGYGYLLLFALVSLAVIVYFWRLRATHKVSIWVAYLAPAASLVGMSVLLVVAIMNFSSLTGGSGAVAVIYQGIIWGSGIVGITLAIFFRAKRPDVFARIGRRNPAEMPKAATARSPGLTETSPVGLS